VSVVAAFTDAVSARMESRVNNFISEL